MVKKRELTMKGDLTMEKKFYQQTCRDYKMAVQDTLMVELLDIP
jgi:hypothetical protein